MKEMKYRVWDSEYKAYVQEYSDYVINPNGELLFYDIDGVFKWANMKVCTIEQCTGIKDKNGKEIYEGDIVRHGLFKQDYKMIVRYREESAAFMFGDKRTGFSFSSDQIKYLEIIGNIHENPELLEVKI